MQCNPACTPAGRKDSKEILVLSKVILHTKWNQTMLCMRSHTVHQVHCVCSVSDLVKCNIFSCLYGDGSLFTMQLQLFMCKCSHACVIQIQYQGMYLHYSTNVRETVMTIDMLCVYIYNPFHQYVHTYTLLAASIVTCTLLLSHSPLYCRCINTKIYIYRSFALSEQACMCSAPSAFLN